MDIETHRHADVFVVLDRAYGLVDGSFTWTDCLEALVGMADIEACRLLLYECDRGQSQVVDAAGIRLKKGRPAQEVDIDQSLWQSSPGDVWLPADHAKPHVNGLGLLGYSVLDRDNAHILYLEFLRNRGSRALFAGTTDLLKTVLPHFHRACRLQRSISGEDLVRVAGADLKQAIPSGGLSTEHQLRRRFRLSKAEARVATLLADGLAPRAIADRLHVSIHTVRSQLQAIFSKTDTSRQAELTSLILRETDVPRAICQTRSDTISRGEQSSCP